MMNKDNRNDKIRKIAKKGLTFSLCQGCLVLI